MLNVHDNERLRKLTPSFKHMTNPFRLGAICALVLVVLFQITFAETNKGIKPRTIEETTTKFDSAIIPSPLECGPVPTCAVHPQAVVLMTLGRSGSAAIWQTMASLTNGKGELSEEVIGKNPIAIDLFFRDVADTCGHWIVKEMCARRKSRPDAKIVGFKWKPYSDHLQYPSFRNALKIIADEKHGIKVVRSRRNILDSFLSNFKHETSNVDAHCKKTNKNCIRKHAKASLNLQVPINHTLKQLDEISKSEQIIDQTLDDYNVPHTDVNYERLFYGSIDEEWNRVFAFLNVSRANFTRKIIFGEMEYASTSAPFHNQTVKNYEELKEALSGTQHSHLLH